MPQPAGVPWRVEKPINPQGNAGDAFIASQRTEGRMLEAFEQGRVGRSVSIVPPSSHLIRDTLAHQVPRTDHLGAVAGDASEPARSEYVGSPSTNRTTTGGISFRRNDAMKGSAVFSPCRRYRYVLWRQWGGLGGEAMIVGLNPSTADATHDDPTIRRCIAFARDWGYAGLCMTNLFAYRATKPADLVAADDPVGPDNDAWLREVAEHAAIVVAAWGVHGVFRGRGDAVVTMLSRLHCLRPTKDGQPGHPLYLPQGLSPVPWP